MSFLSFFTDETEMILVFDTLKQHNNINFNQYQTKISGVFVWVIELCEL